MDRPEPPTDFGRHNMVAFGREALFLSHLPMFMAPHDAQLVLQAALEGPTGSLQEMWSRERESHPEQRLYTMFPEKFALSSLYSPDPPTRNSFVGTFFRGHLERGAPAIPELTDVNVQISKVIYARRLGRSGRPDELSYFLFGHENEMFLAHQISEPPDFDQVLSVRLEGMKPDEEEMQRGVEVVLLDRANSAQERLREGASEPARGHVTGAHQFLDLELTDVVEIYFEEGELISSRGAFEPTELEIEAGFGD